MVTRQLSVAVSAIRGRRAAADPALARDADVHARRGAVGQAGRRPPAGGAGVRAGGAGSSTHGAGAPSWMR